MLRIIAPLGFALAASVGHAASFTPPKGCQLQATVQNRGCSVTQYYQCSADPAGHQRSAILGEDGLRHLSRIDAETRWIESSDPNTGLADFLANGPRTMPASRPFWKPAGTISISGPNPIPANGFVMWARIP
jgi:hypothetical protein